MTVPFEAKNFQDDTSGQYAGFFDGYAAGIHNIDRAGDMILPGAFTDTLAGFLSDGAVCWQHDWLNPIGKPLEAREDSYGLFTKSRISKTTLGLDAMTLIRDEVVKKLSIGYRVQDYQWVDRAGLLSYLSGSGLTETKQQAILQQYDEEELDELFLIKKLKLYEYSPVTVPANPNASITAAKNLSFADESREAIASAKSVGERVRNIHAKRVISGDRPSASHIALCDALAVEHDQAAKELRAVAQELRDAQRLSESLDPQTLYNRFLQIEARELRAA